MGARYITTTLPYVNANPHIGFALEIIQADALARSWRLSGHEVYFNTGSDEHGQKLLEAAEKNGEEVQAYVDRYAAAVASLKEKLNLSNDRFIRTTEPEHLKAAQEMWRRCAQKGDIYKKAYEGLYCVGHEAFITEKDLVDGKCPDHGTEPQLLREENYFFRFSNYQDALRAYLNQPSAIIPEWRRAEALAFVDGGLEDFSISREKARLSWGVPVPDDDTQVMYVWFDALTNYISTLGWPEDASGNFKKFWAEGTTLQMAGKDQIRFQSLIWQAMLLSAEIKPTDSIFYHGFITSGGKKMSKTLGNVIGPLDLVEKYGTDAVRYVLLRHTSPFDDSDLTLEAIHEHYTAHLTNGLGNLVARVMKLAETHLSEPVTTPEEALSEEYLAAIEAFEFQHALDMIWARIQRLDERMTSEAPFALVKTDLEAGKALITEFAQEVYRIGGLLAASMPETSKLIQQAVRENKKPENLFPRL